MTPENVMKIVDLTEALGSLERKVAQQADTIADLKYKLSKYFKNYEFSRVMA